MTAPTIEILDTVDSTNAEARRRSPVKTPLWIAARRQTAARGREGRGWASPPGNLSATLLLPRSEPLAEIARLSFHASLATADLLQHLAPGAEVTLKWPNDALLNGRKVAGILLESFGGAPVQLAVGIGINLVHAPPAAQSRWPATSIEAESGITPDFDTALTVLATRMAHWVELGDAQGFAPIREAWLARAARLGQPIEARLPRETVAGTFEDVDRQGALVLGTSTGRRRIAAADIFFPD